MIGLVPFDPNEVEDRRTVTRTTAQHLSLYNLSARDTMADTIDSSTRADKQRSHKMDAKNIVYNCKYTKCTK